MNIKKVLIIFTMLGIMLTTGYVVYKGTKSVNADEIVSGYHYRVTIPHSLDFDATYSSTNYPELDPTRGMVATFTYDNAVCDVASISMQRIAGYTQLTNTASCYFYDEDANIIDSFNQTKQYANGQIGNISGTVSDSLFRNLEHTLTTFTANHFADDYNKLLEWELVGDEANNFNE